jgi:hypothetical protein
MEMLCISTFGTFGRIKNLSFNKVYRCKFINADRILIIDDSGMPKMHKKINFVNYENIKNLPIYTK